MGLDISVSVNPKALIDNLELNGESWGVNHPETAIALIKSICGNEDTVHTRPGSYSGLHALRDAFIKFKNIEVPEMQTVHESHRKYHLLNHSDCDGWYLPDDFEEVIFTHDVCVGSSYALLRELQEMELERAKLPDEYNWGRPWDHLYVAAVASVVSGQPISFH